VKNYYRKLNLKNVCCVSHSCKIHSANYYLQWQKSYNKWAVLNSVPYNIYSQVNHDFGGSILFVHFLFKNIGRFYHPDIKNIDQIMLLLLSYSYSKLNETNKREKVVEFENEQNA